MPLALNLRFNGHLTQHAIPQASSFVSHCTERRRHAFQRNDCHIVIVRAAGGNERGSSGGEFVDTRIFYDSPDEGWIGGSSTSDSSRKTRGSGRRRFANSEAFNRISQAENSHYTVLGVPAYADGDEIKAAYRRLTKLYHPDTTELPLEVAGQRFMRLKEAYDVLADLEERRVYDWELSRSASTPSAGFYGWSGPVSISATSRSSSSPPIRPSPQVAARYARQKEMEARNPNDVPLSNQAYAALAFDGFALLVALLVVVYVSFFKS